MVNLLDSIDKQILKMIAEDARIPFLEVARECNLSGAAIHQRIQKLTNMGVIKGSQFVVSPEKVGYETCAFIRLYLNNSEKYDFVIDRLKKIPEVVECYFMTGAYDLVVKIYAKSNHHLLKIVHDKLLPLGVERTETFFSESVFSRQIPILDD